MSDHQPIAIPMIVVVRAAIASLKVASYDEVDSFLRMIEEALDPAPAQAVKSRKRKRKPQPVEEVA